MMGAGSRGTGAGSGQVTVRLSVSSASGAPLQDVRLNVSAPPGCQVAEVRGSVAGGSAWHCTATWPGCTGHPQSTLTPDTPARLQDCILLPHVDSQPVTVPIAFTLASAPSGTSSNGGGSPAAAVSSSVPTSMAAQVVATHSSDTGEAWAQTLELALPLCMFCQVVQPIKEAGERLLGHTNTPNPRCWFYAGPERGPDRNPTPAAAAAAEHKLTVGTNRPAPALVALFEDVLACSPAAAGISRTTAANVMSFQLHSGGVGARQRCCC